MELASLDLIYFNNFDCHMNNFPYILECLLYMKNDVPNRNCQFEGYTKEVLVIITGWRTAVADAGFCSRGGGGVWLK